MNMQLLPTTVVSNIRNQLLWPFQTYLQSSDRKEVKLQCSFEIIFWTINIHCHVSPQESWLIALHLNIHFIQPAIGHSKSSHRSQLLSNLNKNCLECDRTSSYLYLALDAEQVCSAVYTLQQKYEMSSFDLESDSCQESQLQIDSLQGPSYQQSQPQIDHLQRLLKDTDIAYKPAQFTCPVKFQLFRHNFDHKYLYFMVKLGSFQFPVSVAHQQAKSRLHYFDKNQYRYASIYVSSGFGKDTVTKCFCLGKEPRQQFLAVLREFWFAQLAGELKLGPKVRRQMGFDLVVFEQCIEFTMEKCSSLQQNVKKLDQNALKKLRNKLILFHSLQMVHKNIKISNIVYNNQENLFFLVDFGVAECLNQKKGEKSLSQFAGSLRYCSDQMRQIFFEHDDKVDLYSNDLSCLQKVKEQVLIKKQLANKGVNFYKIWSGCELNQLPYDHRRTYLEKTSSKIQKQLRQFIEEGYKQILLKYKVWQGDHCILTDQKWAVPLMKDRLNIFQLLANLQSSAFSRQLVEYMQKDDLPKKNRFMGQNISQKETCSKSLLFCSINKAQDQSIQNLVFGSQMNGERKQEMLRQNCKFIAFNPHAGIPQHTYFYYFLSCLDFRLLNSSFSQKVAASKIFINHFKPKAVEFLSQNKEIELALKHIQNVSKSTIFKYFHKIVPVAIINLFIIDAIAIQELLQVIKEIVELDYLEQTCCQSALMLFQLYFVSDWIRARAASLHQNIDVCRLIKQQVAAKLHKLATKCKEPLIILLQKLIESEYSNLPLSRNFLAQNLDYLRHFQLIKKQQLNAVVALMYLNQIGQIDNQERPRKMNWVVMEMSRFDEKIVYASCKVDFYHLRLYYAFKHSQLLQITFYNRLKRALSQHKLLQRYQIFYENQRQQRDITQEELPKAVTALFALSKPKHYKFSCQLLRQWKYWLKALASCSLNQSQSNQLSQRVLFRLKQIYSKDELFAWHFNLHSPYLSPSLFLENIYHLVLLYCQIFQEELEAEIVSFVFSQVSAFQKHFPQHLDTLDHYYDLVKGLFSEAQGKITKAGSIYQRKIDSISQNSDLTFENAYFLTQYTIRLINLCLKADKQLEVNQYLLNLINSVLQRSDVDLLCLSHQDQQKYLKFLKYYPLVIKNDVQMFVRRQVKLAQVLDKHFNLVSIQTFCQQVDYFLSEFHEKIEHLRNVICQQYLSAIRQNGLNQFTALFLSILLKDISEGDKTKNLLCFKILAKAPNFTLHSRNIIIDNSLNYVYKAFVKNKILGNPIWKSKQGSSRVARELRKGRWLFFRNVKWLGCRFNFSDFKSHLMLKKISQKRQQRQQRQKNIKLKFKFFIQRAHANVWE